MKILFITPGCFDKGGISRYSRYQIKSLRELFGIENVKVISLLGPNMNDIEEPFEVYWHGTTNTFKAKIKFVLIIVGTILKWKPSLIHVAHVNFSGLTASLAKPFRIKTLLNVYGIEVWSGLSKDAAYGLRQSDHVISDCHYTAEYIKAHQVTKTPISVIWDCVDLEKFKNDQSRFEELVKKYNLPNRNEYFILLTLGRMSTDAQYKGYSRLIDVFQRVLINGKDVRLVMAGSGDYIETLREKARSLDIESNVTFTGSVDEQDIAGLYSYGHLFSLVTESGKDKGEGIPLTPLEAMACRIPIIVGNQDGSRECVIDHQNGYVIDPWDLDRHAEIICNMADHPDLQNKMAMSAEQMAHQYFGYDMFKSKHKELFDKIARA